MPRVIVMHQRPDLDAVMAGWLLVRFESSRYGDAALAFVPAGQTYKGKPVDADENVIHVDVGYGKFDHHQLGGYGTCATELVWRSLVEQGLVAPSDEALRLMKDYALAIDLFADREWPEAKEARWAFVLPEIIPALHRLQRYDDEAVTRMVWVMLDGVYQRLKDFCKVKQEIKEKGQEFVSKWGRGLALASSDLAHKIAQRMGYTIVVVEDRERNYLGIKLAPGVKDNLAEVYATIREREEGWFYHNSGQMLLWGSDKGEVKPVSQWSLAELVAVIKKL